MHIVVHVSLGVSTCICTVVVTKNDYEFLHLDSFSYLNGIQQHTNPESSEVEGQAGG